MTPPDERAGDRGGHRANDDLSADLSALIRRLDPVPDDVHAGARAAFARRSIHDDIAELVHDSALDEHRLVGVRGGGLRQLSFEGRELAVEVDVAPDGQLVGQLVPSQPGWVEVRHRDGIVRVEADGLGRFAAEGVPAGPVSLRCGRRGAEGATSTDWVVL